MEPRQVVDAYLNALARRDYDRARTFLADAGFSFASPIAKFGSPEDFIQYLTMMGGIVQHVERRKVFVDGGDVCHFLIYTTQLADRQRTPVVQWAQVEGNRIRRIELLFDAHEYKVMFEPPHPPA